MMVSSSMTKGHPEGRNYIFSAKTKTFIESGSETRIQHCACHLSALADPSRPSPARGACSSSGLGGTSPAGKPACPPPSLPAVTLPLSNVLKCQSTFFINTLHPPPPLSCGKTERNYFVGEIWTRGATSRHLNKTFAVSFCSWVLFCTLVSCCFLSQGK